MSLKLSSRRSLSSWVGWFFLINMLLLWLVALSYIPMMPSFDQFPLVNGWGEARSILFMLFAFVGQSALFAFAAGFVVLLLAWLVPRRGFVVFASITLSSLVLLLAVVDAIIYHQYHYHLGSLVWNILISGAFAQVIVLSSLEWLILIVMAVGVVCLESLIAYSLLRSTRWHCAMGHGRMTGVILAACLFLSYAIYLSAGYHAAHPKQYSLERRSADHLVMAEANAVPYYIPLLALFVPQDYFKSLTSVNDGFYTQNSLKNQPLNYPLAPIHFDKHQRTYNIVIIAIDTWRYDMMNAKVTPNIAAFSRKAINYTDNYSGGNSTRAGIFSLFYSLPSTYWSAMLSQHRAPVLIQQLQKEHYQLGIFASASLNFPAFDQTVFLPVKNLQVNTPGDDPVARDKKITQEFNHFIAHRNATRPFFSFLFYDAVHGYCGNGAAYPKPFQPAIAQCNRMALTRNANPLPYINRYKNAVLYDDSLVGEVLKNLEARHLLKNTIVIITADHGEEFNDEHLDYWGHASAFDPYQVRTPLIVYWPGKSPDTIYSQTTHYDVVPTLMRQALHVTTPIQAYSVGDSLFTTETPSFFIVGSYVNYAILRPSRTTIIYSGGDFDITYPDGYQIPNAKLNPILMHQVSSELNRYYQ